MSMWVEENTLGGEMCSEDYQDVYSGGGMGAFGDMGAFSDMNAVAKKPVKPMQHPPGMPMQQKPSAGIKTSTIYLIVGISVLAVVGAVAFYVYKQKKR